MADLRLEPKTPGQKKNRIKFGVASLLYNGDEAAFSPLHTAVIRALGGGDVHLGFMGAMIQSMGQLFSWIGTLILKANRMHRKALIQALFLASIVQGLIVATLLTGHARPDISAVLLLVYIASVAVMGMLTGSQQNIVVSWIGELVPVRQRGWFVSGMAIVSNIGLVLLQMLFARLARNAGLPGYAMIMGIVFLNTLVACFLVATLSDCPARAVNFVSKRRGERVDYFFKPLWGLIWFECAWRSGRVALVAFSTAYLLDHFGLRMDRIILIHMIVNLVNIGMLFLMGRLSDRIGIFRPLAVITAVCACSMLLWVFSAWWGLLPIIAYQVINGAAGSTHWMLVNNLSLELYPAKGRPNYLSLSRMVTGVFIILVSTVAGWVLSQLRGWEINLWGAPFTHYHMFFLGCTLATLTSLLPLYLLRLAKPSIDEEAVVVV
ncbi:MAG: MFS transporter [Verrucomicrobia bacterium]|nr:MFS transporter [Verrucomicrobiota bacterium]MCH8525863.1 MFS transporter [Kiritimatiellia bacterium]